MNRWKINHVKCCVNVFVFCFFLQYIHTDLFALTFTGVSQHCEPALTHKQPLLTELGQLQDKHQSETCKRVYKWNKMSQIRVSGISRSLKGYYSGDCRKLDTHCRVLKRSSLKYGEPFLHSSRGVDCTLLTLTCLCVFNFFCFFVSVVFCTVAIQYVISQAGASV